MLTLKEHLVFLMIIVCLAAVIISPANVQSFDVALYLQSPAGTALGDVHVFLYDWEKVKTYGLNPQAISGLSVSYESQGGQAIPALELSLNKEYIIVLSTRAIAQTRNHMDCFYGKKNGEMVKDTSMDYLNAPRISFTSGTSQTYTVRMPSGLYIQGLIKKKAADGGGPIQNARIELYTDSGGVPVPMQFPFYRFAVTDTNTSYNFKLGGLKAGGKYYIRVIGSHLGYIDRFYTDDAGNPKLFTINDDFQNVGTLELSEGGEAWGYIKDQSGAPVNDSSVVIQALLPVGQQVQPFDFFMNDPNADALSELKDWDKYYFKYDRVQFDPNAKYQIKGLPLDTGYYLKVFETSYTPEFATPIYYDGSTGAYNLRDATTISFTEGFSKAGGKKRFDFKLMDGGCIGGVVSLGAIPSQGTLSSLNVDPNIFNNIPIAVNAYRIEDYGTLTQISRDFLGTGPSFLMQGEGSYSVCGLSAGDYIILAYDSGYKFYPGTYYNLGETITVGSGQNVAGKDITMSLGVMLSGSVLDSSLNPIPDISVSAYRINTTNPLVGYYFYSGEGGILASYPALVDPNNGQFYIWGLPAGSYTVYADGVGAVVSSNKAYLPQYYSPETNGAATPSQAHLLDLTTTNNPNFTVLEDVNLSQSGVASGGIISGAISSANTSSYSRFYFQVFNADTGIEVSSPLYKLDPNTGGYSLMVQYDANYVVAVRDSLGGFVPHYYNSPQTTVNPANAKALLVDSTNPGSRYLTQINFNISETGGYVLGSVLNESSSGVSGLQIYAKQKILSGTKKGLWINVDKTGTTDTNGSFRISGLYPGKYKFSVHDPSFVYAAQFYHSNPAIHPYKAEDAVEWEFNLSNPNQPIVFHIQKGGGISGVVTGVPNAQVYAYLKTDGVSAGGYTDTADPNFNLSGLIPGSYILCYKDPDLDYLPIYYNQSGGSSDPDDADPITVSIGVTVGPKIFTQRQPGAIVEGIVSKSGEAVSGYYVFLYPISRGNKPWTTEPAQYDITDINGYSLRGLSAGDYLVSAVLGNNRPIFRQLTITDSDLGGIKQGFDIVFPQDWQDQRYSRSMKVEKGLNLIAYPTLMPIPVPPYFTGYTSKSFLQDIGLVNGRTGMQIRTYSPDDHTWKSTTYGDTSLEGAMVTSVIGDSFYPRNGQGFLFYSEKAQEIDFWFYPGQTAIWLSEGLNIIGNVACDPNKAVFRDTNIISDNNFTTRKMLSQLGKDGAASIQTLDAKTGKRQSTYWLWGRPTGTNVKVEDDRGYLVGMKKELDGWYPKK
ncbi:carboxypeptidase regulatory-like domain-containing protein [bacterium]|nr:carboxypeptidase regulatory-like domain-containing protein [bacterium]